ncbi:MAG: sirohydrochlorin cobaltochelatase, partial [Deltaproteobacteria bacterium]|nr:sirohydrochlorin cobaltochelatase [Deltaproteobacteria bacterium]
MKKRVSISILVFLLAIAFCSIALASGHGEKKPMKKGVLLVAFGSSMPEAQVSFKNIDKK